MKHLQPHWLLGSIGLGLLGSLTLQYGPWLTAQAQSNPSQPSNQVIEYVELNLADRSRPSEGRQKGGGSRNGNCALLAGNTPLTALVPSQTLPIETFNESQASPADATTSDTATYQSVLSLTTRPYPELWFFVPYELAGSLPLTFVLQDEDSNTLYHTEITPEVAGPGVISVPVPEAYPLSTGDRYHWYLVAQCTRDGSIVDNSYVEGWIERISLSAALQQQLANASPREQAALYASNGIWQDALGIVAEQYKITPNDPQAQADWASLLTSIDNEPSVETAIVDSTVLNCCD
jgi:hypothetical protein